VFTADVGGGSKDKKLEINNEYYFPFKGFALFIENLTFLNNLENPLVYFTTQYEQDTHLTRIP